MGESPPIKAGQLEAMPHLISACTESNTIREKEEIFSRDWEKSAAPDSAEPNSKEILLRLRQLSVCRQLFIDAKILLTPIFCPRLYFVDANILSTPIIL